MLGFSTKTVRFCRCCGAAAARVRGRLAPYGRTRVHRWWGRGRDGAGFSLKMMMFSFKMMSFALKMMNYFVQNDDVFIQNDELCIKNDELFCSK